MVIFTRMVHLGENKPVMQNNHSDFTSLISVLEPLKLLAEQMLLHKSLQQLLTLHTGETALKEVQKLFQTSPAESSSHLVQLLSSDG